ncbi:MAG: Ig-like domain-containing protein, partial [Planctomycetota bacterium]
VVFLLSATVACTLGESGGTGGELPPPEGPPAQFQIVLPPDGSTITAPMQITVTGSGIASVGFEVEGTLIFEDPLTPYEWTLNPGSFTAGVYEVAVTVQHSGGTERRSVSLILAPPPSGPDQPPEVFDAVRNLAPGHWYEIPNTHMEAVQPDPVPLPGYIGGVVGAWGGGAYDTKRDRLIVWGGGHGDYSGNEVYVFDMNTLKWSRITDPSAFPPGDPNNVNDEVVHPDGRPISRHTNNYINYLPPPIDRFYCGGGAGIWKSGQFEDDNTYLFDFDTLEWETKSRCIAAFIGAVCAVAPDGRVWQICNNSGLCVYDATTDTWTKHAPWDGWFGYDYTAAVDSVRNRLIAIGRGSALAWDLSNPDRAHVNLTFTGDTEIIDEMSPGMVYHPGSDRLVMWAGGAAVYTLNLDTLVWTKVNSTGSVSPGPEAENGTYGRFRYSPTQDLFVVVNSAYKNVFVYRLAE